MKAIDSEDQWQAWRIGRDCRRDNFSESDAIARLTGTFDEPSLRTFFDAGFAGLDCPTLTALNPQ
ncbi:hypothetical protein KDX16_30990 [Burkholderia vietnamiensis]|uniref:hypothetical protein n=1 Tax=Burkholderia vietnamiensis TaxID=60552 RepID=UPI000AE5B065|nr:hypothetical protein [Burkholderia vietnamiensis]MBR7920227.1 hypothetical protein [Burkholderia vietnamiensis]MBR8205315.1 hypothetical protein [Burkholderia vietnamiensis]HDR9133237.1 hypothetical protein [Burkholderia vietnamiensis]